MASNMSADLSFLRFNRAAVTSNKDEVSALCVEEVVDQKPLSLEPVNPDGTYNL